MKTFHILVSLLSEGDAEAEMSGAAGTGRVFKDDDVADLILWELYEMKDEGERDRVRNLNLIAATHDATNRSQIDRVAENLEHYGLVRDIGTSADAYGRLTPWAVSFMDKLEKDESVMEHLHNQASGKGDIHFHAPVNDSNLAIHSAGITQTLTSGIGARDLVDTLIVALRNDGSLAGPQREEALADADTIKTELEKSKPNWKVVSGLLLALGAVGSVVEIVEKIKTAIGY